jgi:quinolinate synthase
MMTRAKESKANEFVVATETGILHALRKQNPDKSFHAVTESMICRFMKMITVENLYHALADDQYEVSVPADIAERARLPIERMIAMG